MTATTGLATEFHFLIVMETCSPIWILLSANGILLNAVSIRTFILMNLTDGVTVSLLFTAVFDLAYFLISFSIGVTLTLYIIEQKYSVHFFIDPFGVSIYFFNMMILINITNIFITTFLAIARCMCIARPLYFKNAFTIRRAVVLTVGFAGLSVISYTPILANMNMINRFDSKINAFRIALRISPNREYVKVIVWIVVDLLFPLVTEIIVIVCIVVTANCLRATVRFRRASARTLMATNIAQRSFETQNIKEISLRVSDKLTGKDLRVLQQILLICVVYIICNTPKIVISVVATLEADFTIGKRYSVLYLCVNSIGKNFEIFNSTVSFTIYYKYNSKFRSLVRFC